MSLFEYKIRTKIVRDKEAYLLHELLKDVSEFSTEQGLEEPVIQHTVELKRQLLKRFENQISFFPCGRHLLVHPIDINPCTYSIATLKGCGLRDRDLAKAFGKMVRRKLKDRVLDEKWPLTPDELPEKLNIGVLPELYNAIFHSIRDWGKINEHGYCESSRNLSLKIWAVASDWEV